VVLAGVGSGVVVAFPGVAYLVVVIAIARLAGIAYAVAVGAGRRSGQHDLRWVRAVLVVWGSPPGSRVSTHPNARTPSSYRHSNAV
jgi:hypothetical protein